MVGRSDAGTRWDGTRVVRWLGVTTLVLLGCHDQGVQAVQGVRATMEASIDGVSTFAFERADAVRTSLAAWTTERGEPALEVSHAAVDPVLASPGEPPAVAWRSASPASSTEIGPLVGAFVDTALADAASRAPVVDCTQIETLGYRQGRRIKVSLVSIDGMPIERKTASAFWAMREAALADGVDLRVYSGFRTREQQAVLYECYRCRCCNAGVKAAPPGYSNHQSGRALDLLLRAPEVHPWLAAHAESFGFLPTVPSEPWHWEFRGRPRPDLCKQLAEASAAGAGP